MYVAKSVQDVALHNTLLIPLANQNKNIFDGCDTVSHVLISCRIRLNASPGDA